MRKPDIQEKKSNYKRIIFSSESGTWLCLHIFIFLKFSQLFFLQDKNQYLLKWQTKRLKCWKSKSLYKTRFQTRFFKKEKHICFWNSKWTGKGEGVVHSSTEKRKKICFPVNIQSFLETSLTHFFFLLPSAFSLFFAY